MPIFSPVISPLSAAEDSSRQATIYFFWGESCPVCARQKPFLERMEEKYPGLDVVQLEVEESEENRETFRKLAQTYNTEASGVPMTFIGDFRPLVGFSHQAKSRLEDMISYCLENNCPDPGNYIDREIEGQQKKSSVSKKIKGNIDHTLWLPFAGEVDLVAMPLFVMTFLVAFVDGFNPCSLWLITLLLGIVIPTGDRKKILTVSLTFLLVTAAGYGLFILGVLKTMTYIGYMGWIQVIVAVIAFIFGAVNVKDYFWFKEGISFTIPDRFKPKIFRNFRELPEKEQSAPLLVGAVALMAAGVVLIELPCTAGFPVIWSSIVGAYDLGLVTYSGLFILYLFTYLLVELIIVITAVVTMRTTRLQEVHGRILKLLGGVIMLALAAVMFINPKLMESISAVVGIFTLSFGITALIIIVHQYLLPGSTSSEEPS
ncbi:MAG: hypothetical protein ACQEP7_06985 [bacterium]